MVQRGHPRDCGGDGEGASVARDGVSTRRLLRGLGTALLLALPASRARAVPSFARQTGMPCTTCHTAFPQLTPFGRYFKLTGYTLAGGGTHLPPLAVMAQAGFTHTAKDQAPEDLPPRIDPNDNASFNQVSFFYAGRLLGPYSEAAFGETVGGALEHVGTFLQGTWDGVGREWSWDNMEVRAATTTRLAGQNAILGAYVNNNPTMQDVWNTAPAWSFPFSQSGIAPTPSAAPLIAGGVAQQSVGFGAYAMLADLLYLEVGGYRTLPSNLQSHLGVDPSGETQIDNLAPYWRVALERTFGPHSLEVGTYGLAAHTFPGRDRSQGHDAFTDVALDTQYQYLSDPHDVTIALNWIHEDQTLHASQPLGLAQNPSNTLWTATATGSYLFDKTYGLDVQYFVSGGSRDAVLYGNRTGGPGSEGWIFQLNYLPFNRGGGPRFWPMSNLKLSLQYTLYQRFDGAHANFDAAGRSAPNNNTLYLEAWLAF